MIWSARTKRKISRNTEHSLVNKEKRTFLVQYCDDFYLLSSVNFFHFLCRSLCPRLPDFCLSPSSRLSTTMHHSALCWTNVTSAITYFQMILTSRSTEWNTIKVIPLNNVSCVPDCVMSCLLSVKKPTQTVVFQQCNAGMSRYSLVALCIAIGWMMQWKVKVWMNEVARKL